MSFMPLLALLFIGLKLTNYIDWSWWLVTAPLYVPAIIIVILWVIAFLAGAKVYVKDRK
tara:strand:+ start:390 stop:566 length:177 start_codon:yes stop_codon:yes gene_type:complete